jgi:HSP20 family protein
MPRAKRSFFERLTGAVHTDEYDDQFDEEEVVPVTRGRGRAQPPEPKVVEPEEGVSEWMGEEETEGQLTVDVYQTPDEIVIRSIVAGVRPEDLDVSITRDMVTVRGRREEAREVSDENYFHKELYWGAFSRTVMLPAEVEVENAQAMEKHGLLTIRLPKVDKEKQTKLKVKSS